MNIKLEILDPLSFPEWDKLILANNDYSFFHSSSWARVLSASYGYKPLYFALTSRDKLLVAIPIMEVNSILTGHRGVSLPFSDYCEPISDRTVNFKDVLHQLIDYGNKRHWNYFELRGGGQFLQEEQNYTQYYGHSLTLQQREEEVFSSFRNSTKRNIKKAVKEGVSVRISNSIESLTEFYRLNCITRKKHGLPPQPYYFFKSLHEHIISKKNGFLMLASHQERVVAGAIYFHYGKKAIFKYGASDQIYQHLRANNLVMWEAVKKYCLDGYDTLFLGRTETNNKGLRQFKAGWGAEENTIHYYRYDFKKKSFAKGRSPVGPNYNKVFSRIPVPLLKIIGTMLYRHAG